MMVVGVGGAKKKRRLTSCDGFQETSKITTRLAATKLIPSPPARVDIRNNLKNRRKGDEISLQITEFLHSIENAFVK